MTRTYVTTPDGPELVEIAITRAPTRPVPPPADLLDRLRAASRGRRR